MMKPPLQLSYHYSLKMRTISRKGLKSYHVADLKPISSLISLLHVRFVHILGIPGTAQEQFLLDFV